MKKYDLESWLQAQNFSEATRNIIRNIVNSPPSRRVRGHGGSVIGYYPSTKRGQTIQFESHRNELCFIVVECEYNKSVLDFFDQPPEIKIYYLLVSGRNHGGWITPDFFLIREHSAGWVECKPVEELERLSRNNQNTYFKDDKGLWHYLPGEKYAHPLGLFYEVYSSDRINYTLQRNFTFLEDYLRVENPLVSTEARSAIISLITDKPGITLAEVLSQTGVFNADDIYTLLAAEEIFADLTKTAIVDISRTYLFISRDVASTFTAFVEHVQAQARPLTINVEIGAGFTWNSRPYKIVNLGNSEISIQSDEGHIFSIPKSSLEDLAKTGKIAGFSSVKRELTEAEKKINEMMGDIDHMKKVLDKYAVIAPFIENSHHNSVSKLDRTRRRYIQQYRMARAKYGYSYGIIGLAVRKNRGNRKRRIKGKAADHLKDAKEYYETKKAPSKKAAFGYYCNLCEKDGVQGTSWKTFRAYLKKSSTSYDSTKNRQGEAAAYKDKPFSDFYLDFNVPRHGDRPFEIGHIDSQELPIEIVATEVKMNLGKPHFTVLTDANSRRSLSFSISFNNPSHVSSMMTLRECVARHGRLPQIIVYDRGPEFKKTEFDILLARYELIPKIRPKREARYGSPCERLFGMTNTEFVDYLDGNTKMMKNPRQVAKEDNPKRKAIWTLPEFYKKLEKFLYEDFDTRRHPSLDESPREAFERGMALFGSRPYRLIKYDNDFIAWTLTRPRKGTSMITNQRGFKMNGIYYHDDILRQAKFDRVKMDDRRFDPFNIGVGYAYIDNQWIEGHSEFYPIFNNRSFKELQLISTERLQRNTIKGREFQLSAKQLALRLQQVEKDEDVLRQRQRDLESRKVRDAMTMSRASMSVNGQPDTSPAEPAKGTKITKDHASKHQKNQKDRKRASQSTAIFNPF